MQLRCRIFSQANKKYFTSHHSFNKFPLFLVLLAILFFPACGNPSGGETSGGDPLLTGSVNITGFAKIGGELTANTGSLAGSGTIHYQWHISGSRNGTYADISGATTGTYTPLANDVGKYLKVTVTREGYSGSVTSPATDAIGDADAAPPAVTGVTVDGPSSVAKGETANYTAEVTGTGNPPQTVTWSIIETNKKPGTTINAAGQLSVDDDETLAPITVQAVSTFDGNQYGTKTVAITGGSLSPDEMDDADFGPSAVITRFTAGGVTEWNEAIEAIQGGGNDKNYVITLTGSFAIPGNPITYTRDDTSFGEDVTGITVSLRGEKTLSLSSKGSLLRIGSGQTLALWESALQGSSDNNTSLVWVAGSGSLIMHSGEISGNSDRGVYVSSEGTFTMHGGTISGNSVTGGDGGGVYVSSEGTFTMNGGTISGNSGGYGVGVYVSGGTFTMSGGTISGNSATGNIASSGGGVYVSGGTFTMSGGNISGNSVTGGNGGGVSVGSGTFTMSSGTISGNSATGSSSDGRGGGVSVVSNGTFSMSGGEISGNTAAAGYGYGGGGVDVSYNGTFSMSGGTIGGNTATSGNGGGVFMDSNGTFTKTGGTVYGSDAGASNRNQAKGSGHAVYKRNRGLPANYRDTTAGPGDNINTANGTGLSTADK
jgi:hypothetical protein